MRGYERNTATGRPAVNYLDEHGRLHDKNGKFVDRRKIFTPHNASRRPCDYCGGVILLYSNGERWCHECKAAIALAATPPAEGDER